MFQTITHKIYLPQPVFHQVFLISSSFDMQVICTLKEFNDYQQHLKRVRMENNNHDRKRMVRLWVRMGMGDLLFRWKCQSETSIYNLGIVGLCDVHVDQVNCTRHWHNLSKRPKQLKSRKHGKLNAFISCLQDCL